VRARPPPGAVAAGPVDQGWRRASPLATSPATRWVAGSARAGGSCRAAARSPACYDVARDGGALPGVARGRLVAPQVRGGGAVVVLDRGAARLPRYDRFPGPAPPWHQGADRTAGRGRAGPGLRPADCARRAARAKPRRPCLRCLCACGRETDARAVELQQGKIRSCGCLRDETRQSGHTRQPSVHSGQRYGRLVVLHEAGRESPSDPRMFSCGCGCGSTMTVRGAKLTSGHT
jgi:hypothetical protein